jgi:hypothetical protein
MCDVFCLGFDLWGADASETVVGEATRSRRSGQVEQEWRVIRGAAGRHFTDSCIANVCDAEHPT